MSDDTDMRNRMAEEDGAEIARLEAQLLAAQERAKKAEAGIVERDVELAHWEDGYRRFAGIETRAKNAESRASDLAAKLVERDKELDDWYKKYLRREADHADDVNAVRAENAALSESLKTRTEERDSYLDAVKLAEAEVEARPADMTESRDKWMALASKNTGAA